MSHLDRCAPRFVRTQAQADAHRVVQKLLLGGQRPPGGPKRATRAARVLLVDWANELVEHRRLRARLAFDLRRLRASSYGSVAVMPGAVDEIAGSWRKIKGRFD